METGNWKLHMSVGCNDMAVNQNWIKIVILYFRHIPTNSIFEISMALFRNKPFQWFRMTIDIPIKFTVMKLVDSPSFPYIHRYKTVTITYSLSMNNKPFYNLRCAFHEH